MDSQRSSRVLQYRVHHVRYQGWLSTTDIEMFLSAPVAFFLKYIAGYFSRAVQFRYQDLKCF